jgi:hypothetical protein
MAKKKEVPSSSFMQVFFGEFVLVTTSHSQTIEQQTAEGEITSMQTQLAYEGFLLDEDDIYYYLGDTPDSINRVIKKEHVLEVSITDQNKVTVDTSDTRFN